MKPRLLKRIKAWEESGVVSSSDVDANEILESLRDDIEKLFNTRRGTVLIDDDYGLPDFTHLMNGYAAPEVGVIERDLLAQIKRYEKRLSSISFSYQPPNNSLASLTFTMNAMFSHKEQDIRMAANVQFFNDGSVTVDL